MWSNPSRANWLRADAGIPFVDIRTCAATREHDSRNGFVFAPARVPLADPGQFGISGHFRAPAPAATCGRITNKQPLPARWVRFAFVSSCYSVAVGSFCQTAKYRGILGHEKMQPRRPRRRGERTRSGCDWLPRWIHLLFPPRLRASVVAFLRLRSACAFDARENVHDVATRGGPCDWRPEVCANFS